MSRRGRNKGELKTKSSTGPMPMRMALGAILAVLLGVAFKIVTRPSAGETALTYDDALEALYEEAARSNRCTFLWREPGLHHPELELLSALQGAAAPFRETVEDASAEAEAARLGAAAAASRLGASSSSTLGLLLHELADALERDAALTTLASSAAPEHRRARALAKGVLTDSYFEIGRTEPDAEWTAAQMHVAAAVVRVAFARFAMLADEASDRFIALSVWLGLDAERAAERRSFCGAAGTDPELAVIARVLADDAEDHSLPVFALEDASAVAGALARAAARHLTPGDARGRRLEANRRRATVLLAEDLGGLKTPTDEAQYGRAASILAPVEAAIREDSQWEACPDVVAYVGGALPRPTPPHPTLPRPALFTRLMALDGPGSPSIRLGLASDCLQSVIAFESVCRGCGSATAFDVRPTASDPPSDRLYCPTAGQAPSDVRLRFCSSHRRACSQAHVDRACAAAARRRVRAQWAP